MITKSDRHLRTLPLAKAAIEQIERLGLPADPQSFELWYAYASGYDADINKSINAVLSSTGGLTESEFDRLCELHISSRRSVSRLNAITAGLSLEIAEVMSMIGAAAVSSEHYDRHLGEGLQKIERMENHQSIKHALEALITATKNIENETRVLELRLEESRIRTIELQKDVDLLRLENSTDPLTLVRNRQYFDESLVKMIASAKESGEPLSLLFADIDRFKKFNDVFGHQTGDQVLRLVAKTIKETMRDEDVVARYGGEEFGVILPNTPLAVARLAAERVRLAIMAKEIKKRTTQELLGRITISIGVVQLRHEENPTEFVERADACAYAAKQSGRNRVASEHVAEFLFGKNQPSRSAMSAT